MSDPEMWIVAIATTCAYHFIKGFIRTLWRRRSELRKSRD